MTRAVLRFPCPAPEIEPVTTSPSYSLVPEHLRKAADDLAQKARDLSVITSRQAALDSKLSEVPAILADMEATIRSARISIRRGW